MGVRTSLDRLVVRIDLLSGGRPVVPIVLAVVTGPSLLAVTHLVGSRPFAVAALVATLLPALWLALWMGRAFHLGEHPHASARWLRAVRGVVGDRVMDQTLDRLRREWARHPGHLLTYHEVAREIWARRG